MSKQYVRMMWGGFVCGKLSQSIIDDQWGGEQHMRPMPALFYTRREARKQYQDVRKVYVVEGSANAEAAKEKATHETDHG